MTRSVLSLVAGLVLAVIAVVLLNYYVRNVRAGDGAQAAPPADVTQVLVAAVDLPLGAKLKTDDFKSVSWPTASMPQDAFHAPDEVFAGANGQDRIVLKPIGKDQPVLKSQISGFGTKTTLSSEVPPGMRAVSIRIDDVSGVAGFLLPGDRVDVMLTRKLEGKDANDGGLVTDIILQSVQVLGIDQLADQDRDKPLVARTATVAVTPQDAQKLALAQQSGTLGLALRSVNSVDRVPTGRIVQGDLTPELRPPPQTYHRRHWAPAGVTVVYGAK